MKINDSDTSQKIYAHENSKLNTEKINIPVETMPVITENELTPQSEAPVFDSEQYVVTLSDTKILIYKISHDGSMQTIEEKAIDTGSIPREDYAKLYSGIIVSTLEEAKQIVEDYIS